MLVSIPPHLSVSQFMGYFVDTVGKYETAIREYIENQRKDDIMNDQLSLKEYIDPFTGSREK